VSGPVSAYFNTRTLCWCVVPFGKAYCFTVAHILAIEFEAFEAMLRFIKYLVVVHGMSRLLLLVGKVVADERDKSIAGRLLVVLPVSCWLSYSLVGAFHLGGWQVVREQGRSPTKIVRDQHAYCNKYFQQSFGPYLSC